MPKFDPKINLKIAPSEPCTLLNSLASYHTTAETCPITDVAPTTSGYIVLTVWSLAAVLTNPYFYKAIGWI
jgi:hypothetical protein